MTPRRPRSTGTVRWRVTVAATSAVVLVLVAAGVALVVEQERRLTESLDESLKQGATSIGTAVAAGRVPTVVGGFGDDDAFAQIVDAGGTVLASTENVAGRGALLGPPAAGNRGPRTVRGLPIDGGAYRVVSSRADGPTGPVAVHVGATLDDVAESRDVLVTSLTVAIPLVAGLLAAMVWMLVGRTLRPVEDIRAEVAAIGGSDLHRRVPEPPGQDEIARLARTMNAMLDRVEDAAVRQQRFAADASHELRSPLARMRAELEVDLAHPAGADPAATHRSVVEEVAGLQRLVEDLLHLARGDAALTAPRMEPTDLDDVVLRAAGALRAGGGPVRVDVSGVGAVQVLGDAAQLGRAIGNLAENAARHASSRVTFTVAARGDMAEVTVADDGPGVALEHQQRVFERFARTDEARHGAAGGTGLGLAIARDIVVRHGGTLIIDPDHQPGARLVLVVPLGPPPSAEHPASQ